MTQCPTISVIIPTYDRILSLSHTLDSLAGQSLDPSEFEVIVVDDGSADSTFSASEVQYPFHLEYHTQRHQGAAAARNHGVEASHGQLLVFIDDDIILDAGYLEAVAHAHRLGEKLISMGAFQAYHNRTESVFAALYPRVFPVLSARQASEFVSFTACTSNNLIVDRESFLALGAWHDILRDGPTLWGDVDFGYRAWKQGYRFLAVADARLYHEDYSIADLETACKRNFHVSYWVHALFHLHPEIELYLDTYRDKAPISFSSDSPGLVFRKVLRHMTASPPSVWTMRHAADLLEMRAPDAQLLVLLYRWIISACIFRGYRQGLRDRVAE